MPDGQRLAVAVADIFDAVTSDRIYRSRMNPAEAFQTLDRLVEAGHIDGDCVKVFKEIIARQDRGELDIPGT